MNELEERFSKMSMLNQLSFSQLEVIKTYLDLQIEFNNEVFNLNEAKFKFRIDIDSLERAIQTTVTSDNKVRIY